MRIDLHAHSTASDGAGSPALVRTEAAAAGLDVVALTDHDTVAGWDEAAAALPPGLTLVRGAEISCTVEGIGLHLLGYLFDPRHAGLADLLARTREDRIPRAQEMVRRLASDGVPIHWEAVLAQTGGATVGRPHLADALVAAGVVRHRDEAFASYLHRSGPYYVRHFSPEPSHALRELRAAGGVAVVAHVGAFRRGRVVSDSVVAALAAAGMVGLEVDHPDHDAATRARLRGLAADLGLLITGGSDYHGWGRSSRLGDETTAPEVYEALVARATGGQPVAA